MREAQCEFDNKAAPLCPEHLDSPVLHRVLSYQPIQEHIWGGKGVGSQASALSGCCTRASQISFVTLPDVKVWSLQWGCWQSATTPDCSLQGDGTAQFVCRSQDDQAAVCQILERDLGMHCTRLTLEQTDDAHHPADAQVNCHMCTDCKVRFFH